MSKKQPHYTPEFRQRIIELVRAGLKPQALSVEFGCHVSSVHYLLRQAQGSKHAVV